ncbi:competence-related pilin export protein ComGB [Salsuginibacillus halophilus]|uniref:Competence-related pilin export protein ComGB n=1 Tax=Salsuginibacillus halophilus TaxID=517424 RepID=A0A2P8H822_9BACI|nr:competence type IV pilus assembly protein ComGB [Salsuginibacillus halophilus]PSL42339.1 competence-related pilin export protein ComGB [Salsuginibacillus halophilus]
MSRSFPPLVKAQFLTKLGRLLSEGYTLHDASRLIFFDLKPEAKGRGERWLQAVRQGTPLHESFSLLEVPSDVQALIYTAEKNGKLSDGLIEAGRTFTARETFKRDVRRMLRYPLALLFLFAVMVMFILFYILPAFQELFRSLSADLPPLTVFVIQILHLLPVLMFAAVVPVAGALVWYWYKVHPRPALEKLCLFCRVPGLRRFVKRYVTYRFSEQFGQLLCGGFSTKEALHILYVQAHVPFLSEESERLQTELKGGETLSDALSVVSFHQPELAAVTAHGEQSGRLGRDLTHYSAWLREDIEHDLRAALQLLQPIMFAGIGLLILCLFLAVFLPVFQLMGRMDM